MKLVVGLGNPGAGHARQRHNVGFMAADAIAERFGVSPQRRRFQGLAAEGVIGGERVLILKPQTFMNESGRSVGEAARFYKLGPDDIIVLHDEIDLAPGKVRVKRGGGVAGHNGLKSLAAHLGPDFIRVRIGIGHPGAKHLVQRHVLNDFAKTDHDWLAPLLDAIVDHADKLVAGDHANFMNEVARAGTAAADTAPERVPPKTPRKARLADKPRTPSQRDLARAAAEARRPRRRETGAAPTVSADGDGPRRDGPLARLRRLFSARPPDRG